MKTTMILLLVNQATTINDYILTISVGGMILSLAQFVFAVGAKRTFKSESFVDELVDSRLFVSIVFGLIYSYFTPKLTPTVPQSTGFLILVGIFILGNILTFLISKIKFIKNWQF